MPPPPRPRPRPRPPLPPPPTRLKGEVHDSIDGANEVFGGVDGQKCRCHWLLPLPARFPPGDAAARIFGYCINSNSNGNGSSNGNGWGGRGGSRSNSVGGAAVSETELAEYGGLLPNPHRHDAEDDGGGGGSNGSNGSNGSSGSSGSSGGKGALYAVPEAESGLRRSAQLGLEERLAAMPEADSGSEGEFR